MLTSLFSSPRFATLALLAAFVGSALPVAAQNVRIRTNLGDIDIVLLTSDAPATVRNFLNYMNRGDYNGSFFHRSVPGFVVQGGGFRLTNNQPVAIPQDPPVVNEFRVNPVRGTLAMAKLGNDPNSATNQFFFNLVDNSAILNGQNGGFTVFARIVNSSGLAVMDRMAAVPRFNLGGAFTEWPLQNYSSGATVQESNLIQILSMTTIEAVPPPVVSISGITAASAFGGFNYGAPGSFMEIYGANLANSSRTWGNSDFFFRDAPTVLNGVTVSANGQPCFVSYVSPTQVNVQLPANLPTDGQIPIVVTAQGVASAAFQLNMRPVAPGLLAPASFRVGDRQYVAALNGVNGTFIANGTFADLPNNAARAGDVLLLYGLGFGRVTPDSNPVAGKIAEGTSRIVAPVRVTIGGQEAALAYAGFAPNFVGLYQFNVTVPSGLSAGDQLLEVTLDGQRLPQTLYLPVR